MLSGVGKMLAAAELEPQPAATSFEDVVNRYYQGLYQFAFSLTRAQADALDLTQQTFYVWASKGHQLRDESKVKTWLFTTLHREFLRSRRRWLRFPHIDLHSAEPELPAAADEPAPNLDSGAVLAALGQVDEVYRAPLALFYMEEHSYRDIAELLNVPVGTVQSRISRGKAQLKRALAGSASKEARHG